MALVYQRVSGPALRATLARFFLAASVLTIMALVPAGKLGRHAVLAGLIMVPGVLLGFACSGRLIGRRRPRAAPGSPCSWSRASRRSRSWPGSCL